LILGYINPEFLAGGTVPLQAELSHRGFRNDIAGPMGMSLAQATHGAFRIVASNMNRAIRAVSSERGRDPRRLAMVAFGGNGPIFAAAMAEDLGIRHILVPPFAGLFSAVGLLHAQVEHQFPRSFRRSATGISVTELQVAWAEMAEAARTQLIADGVAAAHIEFTQMVRLRYVGQTFELAVPMPGDATDIGAVLAEQFGCEHERSYGHRAAGNEPVEIVGLLLIARGPATAPPRHAPVAPTEAPPRCRQVYFGGRHGWLETPIIGRSALAQTMAGPCIVEEYDATCVVPPGAQAMLDEFGNIRLDIGDASGVG
jgi:N-methylhydantoinase A